MNWWGAFLQSWERRGVFVIWCLLISILLLDCSRKIAMADQGDYPRTIGFMLGPPLDVVPYNGRQTPAFHWRYLKNVDSPFTENNSAAIYFWLAGKLQTVVEPDFNLYLAALLSKCIVLVCCFRIATRYFQGRQSFRAAPYLTFALLALAFFYAHNVSFLNSLYAEHAFLVGLAILVCGFFEEHRGGRITLIVAGLLLAGASKPQYFYLPLLLGSCYATTALVKRETLDRVLMAALIGIQVVSLLPLLKASTRQVNYYHSLYFGSYDLLAPAELRELGVPPESMGCIGLDWWNWRIVDHDPAKVTPDLGRRNCHIDINSLTLHDVLKPYVAHPFLLFRLAAWALPKHFTDHYFEVIPGNFYLRPSAGESYHNGAVLLLASKIRERIVTPFWPVFVIAGIALAFAPAAIPLHVRTVVLFLALSVPSQIAICLLGEGIRDLSRHLASAQLSLDVLSAICVLELCAFVVRRLRSRSNWVHASNKIAQPKLVGW